MTSNFKFYLLSAFLLMIVGCQPNQKIIEKIIEKPIQTSESTNQTVEVNDTMNDEELANSGEQLMIFPTIPLAEKAFKMALQKNPNNLKAQFYTEGFLKNYTVYKGFLTRIRPLVIAKGKLKKLEELINSLPSVPMKKYLLDGKEDIRTVADVQDFLFEIQNNANSFRKWLIKNYDKSLVLNLDLVWAFSTAGSESKYSCEVINEQEGRAVCNYNNIFTKKIAPPDLLALRQMIAGEVLFFNFYTSYSFEGFDKLNELDPENKLSPQQAWANLNKYAPTALTLRKNNLLKEVISIGSDLVEAVKYAKAYKEKLCPKGNGFTRQRPGYFFQDGICIENHDEEFSKLELALAGIPTLHKKEVSLNDPQEQKSKEFKMDLLALFRNPVDDLRSIGPADFDNCGQVKSLKDKTFGGVFIAGDAEEFFLSPKKTCSSLTTLE